jgi:hypothetical protein
MILEEDFLEVVRSYKKEIADYLESYVMIYEDKLGCVYESKYLQINMNFKNYNQSIYLLFSDYDVGSASSQQTLSQEKIPIAQKDLLFQTIKEMDKKMKFENIYN